MAIIEPIIFTYTGNIQRYTVENDGIYKLEVYGAQGGNTWKFSNVPGGKGGYSVGYKKLTKGDVLYIVCGGKGLSSDSSSIDGGFNGGGKGSYFYDSELYLYGTLQGGSGGGATHIARVTGTLAEIGENTFRENGLIIAGGGGGSCALGTTASPATNIWNGGDGNDSNATGSFGLGADCATTGTSHGSYYGGAGGGGGYKGGLSEGTYGGKAYGGSGWIDGVPEFAVGNIKYTPRMENGINSGNGYAIISLINQDDIDVGDYEVNEIYVGDYECNSVCIGDKEIWSSYKSFYVGFGKTFDIKSIYDKYADLTIDDFFVRLDTQELIRKSYSCGCWDGSSCNGCCNHFSDSVSFTKSYNATTGEFKCNYGGHDVYVYLIPNSNNFISKGLISNLGNGTSFTISAKDKDKCTNNNFLFRTLPTKDSYYDCCSYSCPNRLYYEQDYSATTGVLTARVYAMRASHQSDNVNPFYISTSLIK